MKTESKIAIFSSGIRNFDLESKIYHLCSPFRARKIVLELCRASDKLYVVKKISPEIFEVRYKNNDDKPLRIVNLDLLTCNCMRKVYFGYSCSHILAAMMESKMDISSKMELLVQNRWKIQNNSIPIGGIQESTLLQFKLFKTTKKKKEKETTKKKKIQEDKSQELTEISMIKYLSPQTRKQEKSSAQTNSKSSPPKKPLTAFFLFVRDVKEEYQKMYPNYNWPNLIKVISSAYKGLPASKKKKYEDEATIQKQIYEADLQSYNRNGNYLGKSSRKNDDSFIRNDAKRIKYSSRKSLKKN